MLPLQLKLSAILSLTLVVIFALAATNYWSYSKGYSNASTLHSLRYEERETELLEQSAKAKQALLNAERSHAASVASIQADYERRAQEQAARDAVVIADLRNAQQRVRVKVTDCRDTAVPAPTAPVTKPDGNRTAELDLETAARIWAIAADGQRAVEKLTALQAWAREAVKLCRQ